MNEAIRQQVNRLVTPEEIEQALHGDISSDERDEVQSLIRWFTARYPTAEARLAYVRHAYARWLINSSPASRRGRKLVDSRLAKDCENQ